MEGRRKAAHSGSRGRAAPHPAPRREQQTAVGKLRDCASSENEGFEAFPPRYLGASSPAAIQAAVIVLIMIFTLFPWAPLAEIRKTQSHRVGTGPEESGWQPTPGKQETRAPLGGPAVSTLLTVRGGAASLPGWGRKTLHASRYSPKENQETSGIREAWIPVLEKFSKITKFVCRGILNHFYNDFMNALVHFNAIL